MRRTPGHFPSLWARVDRRVALVERAQQASRIRAVVISFALVLVLAIPSSVVYEGPTALVGSPGAVLRSGTGAPSGVGPNKISFSQAPACPSRTSSLPVFPLTCPVHPSGAVPSSSPPDPSARCCSAMSFDPVTNATYLFGGVASGPFLNDTWTFRADTWTLVPSIGGPSPRGGAMMTFDPTLGLVLLYGGFSPTNAILSDLWAFNGSTWTLLNASAPLGGRAAGVFAFDPLLDGDILFGGNTNGPSGSGWVPTNYTWLLRGGSWINVTTTAGTAPPAAAGMAGDYDPNMHGILVFGGGTVLGYLNGTWLLRNGSWSSVSTPVGPVGRWYAAMAFDAGDNETLLFGGEGGSTGSTVFFDTWVFRHNAWSEWNGTGRPSPLGAIQSSIAVDPNTSGVVVFGGFTGSARLNATWVFAEGNWSQVLVFPLPTPGGNSMVASAPSTNLTLLVTPGYGSTTSQTWELVNGSWSLLNLSLNPPSYWYPSFAYDPSVGCFLLFGGAYAADPATVTNASWAFCSGAWTDVSSRVGNAPSPRWGAQVAYDPYELGLVLFGGSNGIRNFTDTWELRNWTWSNLGLAVHPGEGGFAQAMSMAYDPETGGVIWVGASGQVLGMTEMWTFSNGTWANTSDQLPARLADVTGVALAYDSGDGYLLGFGGACYQGCSPLAGEYRGNETWEYSLGSWKLLSPSLAPPARSEGRMTYDSGSSSVILVGGSGRVPLGDTWAYSGGNWTELSPLLVVSPGAVDIGRNVSVTIRPSALTAVHSVTAGGWLAVGCNPTLQLVYRCFLASPGEYRMNATMTGVNGLVAVASGTAVANPLPTIQSVTIDSAGPVVGQPFTVSSIWSGGTAPFGFTYSGLPAPCPSQNSSTIRCTPTNSGNYTITVSIRDADGVYANGTVLVSVALSAATHGGRGSASTQGSLELWLPVVGVLGLASGLFARRVYLRREAARLLSGMREVATSSVPSNDGESRSGH
ncbi:MAG TPA: kelch repeat-containing protein [Thermoplasmata archaeon]|nr:kelch repeat-containing protein [Thermoplasmata archaeon]